MAYVISKGSGKPGHLCSLTQCVQTADLVKQMRVFCDN